MSGPDADRIEEFIAQFYEVVGETDAEDVRHVIARTALRMRVLNDDALMDTLIRRIGVKDTPSLEGACDFVERDLRLNCPWLAWELFRVIIVMRELVNEHGAAIIDQLDDAQQIELAAALGWWLRIDPADPPAPHLPALAADWEAGLTASEAALRLRAFEDQVRAALRAATPAKRSGVIRDDIVETTWERVDWFFAARVKGASIKSIAADAGRDRVDVRAGIADAERWLVDVASVRFTSPGGGGTQDG